MKICPHPHFDGDFVFILCLVLLLLCLGFSVGVLICSVDLWVLFGVARILLRKRELVAFCCGCFVLCPFLSDVG